MIIHWFFKIRICQRREIKIKKGSSSEISNCCDGTSEHATAGIEMMEYQLRSTFSYLRVLDLHGGRQNRRIVEGTVSSESAPSAANFDSPVTAVSSFRASCFLTIPHTFSTVSCLACPKTWDYEFL
ncbi:hypothetical protein Ccrd_013043 [Cynara cardunculus var. scolymus]|uniref:Uncharacterized protein n=1 Tax=Cynara cardunculus var. scolymus TaxID=59895 RepID=A0A103YGB2_CYNCS|nr:hypothetical protein Ccrd_013043 [Cynara cardunculus var. scolymus]